MELYCGIDLHSNNSYLVVLEAGGRRHFARRLPNDLGLILAALAPFRDRLTGVVVESTCNWYWLVDGLMAAGYRLHLANPAAMKPYAGLKQVDDRSDADWLARSLALGILPEGYIYPAAERPLRDLLRRRSQQVALVERAALERVRPRDDFQRLLGVRGIGPGIGKALALTILLETGEIGRFPKVGNYASYCRLVESKWISNAKLKGAGNVKCGNKYLAWAYMEAAHFAVRYEPRAKRYYARKMARSNVMLAKKAVAHKMARGCYYVLRDGTPFDPKRCFG